MAITYAVNITVKDVATRRVRVAVTRPEGEPDAKTITILHGGTVHRWHSI